MTVLRIYDWHFLDPEVEYVYITDADPPEFSPACGIERELSQEARRAREYELEGYAENPTSFKFKAKVGRIASEMAEVDEQSVRSMKLSDLERREPGWFADVKLWWELYRREDMVSYESGLPLYTVRAVMEILAERGELAAPLDEA